MTTYTIPAFIWIKKIGKNEIRQFVCDEIPTSFHSYDGNILVLTDSDGRLFYIYKAGWKIRDKDDFVLVTNKKPTYDLLLGNELTVKWVKHPHYKGVPSPEYVLSTWNNGFLFKEEDLSKGVFGLRSPQIGALHAVLSHWKVSDDRGTVVMPTGTGKTEVMMSLLVCKKCSPLLITAPTDSLRNQLSRKFQNLGLLKRFGIVLENSQTPIVGILYEKLHTAKDMSEFIMQCNVIITTMSITAESATDVQKELAKYCAYYFIDEAHHIKAKTWNDFVMMFEPKRVVQFTATPFRNDGQRLDGSIIFDYPLKKAQQDGYFKHINFDPIWEYSPTITDAKLAEKAVDVLRRDIKCGYKSHIVMARCANKKRADEVYGYYQKYTEFNPVKIYSGQGITSAERSIIYDTIINKKTSIIVCVDMLGEGFDLPELKIAAFHDIKKSLTITLQLAGRFTRTKYDEELGEATFIANLADLEVTQELDDLYAQDADWNLILPRLSKSQIEEEIKYDEYIKGFRDFDKFAFPLQNMKPALSTVVYQNNKNSWHPENYKLGLNMTCKDKANSVLNPAENVLVIVLAQQRKVDWGNFKDIQNVTWTLLIVYRDIEHRLLFINSSDNSSLYADLACAIIGEKTALINKMDIFKAFHNINRIRIQNVGLKEFLGKNIRFRMSVGSDVEEALSLAEKQRAQKAFVFAVGYENGDKVSLGCSYKGRVWTRLEGDIKKLTDWCKHIASKIIDKGINPNTLLKDTLIPKLVTNIPLRQPIWIDWNDELYLNTESRMSLIVDGKRYAFCNIDLNIDLSSELGKIGFSIACQPEIEFKCALFLSTDGENAITKYEIVESKYKSIQFQMGQKVHDFLDFLNEYEPTIWIIAGSALCGNELVDLKQIYPLFPKERIERWDWDHVNLNHESQDVFPKVTDSIQYSLIQRLLKGDYDIVYDDDNSGEIADVITIKEDIGFVKVELYHLKFAKGGCVSGRIDNLYEVCGQAQKSIRWKFKDGNEFFDHLLRREEKSWKGHTCSRIERGSKEKLIYFSQITKRKHPIKFDIIIIQPGISPDVASDEQLSLLSVADNYIKEIADINLRVVGNIRNK